MKALHSALAIAVISLGLFATPAEAVEVCQTYALTASSAWVFNETDVRLTVMRPGSGNNEGDCMTDPWRCATYRCEVGEESELGCKETPGGLCLDLVIERCVLFPEGVKYLPIIRNIAVHGTSSGPCE